jgi:acyl-CoA reductase-like NAD-dependent aldehyde dehydrogenase
MEPSYKRLSPDARFYFTGKPCKYGHTAQRYSSNSECVDCRAAKNVLLKDKQQEWSVKNKDKRNALSRAMYQANAEKQRERSRLKWINNKEKVKATNKAWADKNVGIWNHYAAKRRSALRQRTPSWACMETIKAVYRDCPDGHHVDHIVPLRGKTVCGFHSHDNLQYLPAAENQRKFNRLEESYVYA